MHKLKGDVWTNIQTHLGAAKPSRRLEAPVAPAASEVSFHELVKDLSSEEDQQKDVSLAYYFICLLHLANENVSLVVSCATICCWIHWFFVKSDSEDQWPRRHGRSEDQI